jgi:hypothetical protein
LIFCNFSYNPFVCPIPTWATSKCGATCYNSIL